jgi:DNA-binding NarL/FixJ family response regulator
MLVVDDSEAVRAGVRQIFEAHALIEIAGVAADGREGMDAAMALWPDLVLTDWQMPRMTGLQLTRWLRQALPATRIIVMSVHDGQSVRAACEEAGAHGFVGKIDLYDGLPREIGRIFGFPP